MVSPKVFKPQTYAKGLLYRASLRYVIGYETRLGILGHPDVSNFIAERSLLTAPCNGSNVQVEPFYLYEIDGYFPDI
jgi:hypothetical protein